MIVYLFRYPRYIYDYIICARCEQQTRGIATKLDISLAGSGAGAPPVGTRECHFKPSNDGFRGAIVHSDRQRGVPGGPRVAGWPHATNTRPCCRIVTCRRAYVGTGVSVGARKQHSGATHSSCPQRPAGDFGSLPAHISVDLPRPESEESWLSLSGSL